MDTVKVDDWVIFWQKKTKEGEFNLCSIKNVIIWYALETLAGNYEYAETRAKYYGFQVPLILCCTTNWRENFLPLGCRYQKSFKILLTWNCVALRVGNYWASNFTELLLNILFFLRFGFTIKTKSWFGADHLLIINFSGSENFKPQKISLCYCLSI